MADPIEPRRERLARFLRQRGELGVAAWILEDLTAEMAERAVRGARAGDPGPPAPLRRIPRPEGAAATGPTAPEPGPDRPSAGPGELPTDYDELEGEARNCTRCRLCEDRTHVVFSDGSRQARVMVVGEAPGANEDRTGVPFVGPAGKLLDLLLASVDLSRDESVYICNVIKCRPPQNRNPRADEIEMCAPYLHRQIELVQPEAILAVGTFAGKLLSGLDRALGKLRGEVHSYRGTPLVVTYHPAALLRNSGWTRPTWEDLQLLRGVIDGG